MLVKGPLTMISTISALSVFEMYGLILKERLCKADFYTVMYNSKKRHWFKCLQSKRAAWFAGEILN